jgi:CDP-diacylglycerol--glycerol-3-phosphate 3-phosphatidyltransferase
VNLPIGLTITRIVAVPLLILFLISSSRVHAVIAAAIFILASITDWLDGVIARRRNQVTTLGTLLDPIADKLLISAAFISLVELGLAPAWMVVVIIGREFAVSGLRSIASSRGIVIPASGWGKAKMVTQIAAVSLLILAEKHGQLLPAGRFALWLVVAVALISGVEYFLRFFRQIVLEGPPPSPEP